MKFKLDEDSFKTPSFKYISNTETKVRKLAQKLIKIESQ